MPKVYNKRNKDVPENAIYVGRPSRYGNPYRIGPDGNREQVLSKFRDYINRTFDRQDLQNSLRGKDLVCWCAPEACHADVLLEIANA